MGGEIVLVDTGPLEALFDPSDRDRAGCRACLDSIEDAHLVTTEPVVTEALYLLAFSTRAQVALLELLASGRPRVEPLEAGDRREAARLIAKYADLPMDYADATLVLVAERLDTTRVFSLDRKDFGIYCYRARRRRLVPIPEQWGHPSGRAAPRAALKKAATQRWRGGRDLNPRPPT